MNALPFAYSYWVIPGRLMAGFFPGSVDPMVAEQRQRALVACGIRSMMNLMEPDETNLDGEPFPSYVDALDAYASEAECSITCHRIPIRDMDVPTPETMIGILDAIDHALDAGDPVYVHCWGGKGRTGTVVGCWMVRHGIVDDGDAALARIRELRHRLPDADDSPQTEAQRAMVRTWRRGM